MKWRTQGHEDHEPCHCLHAGPKVDDYRRRWLLVRFPEGRDLWDRVGREWVAKGLSLEIADAVREADAALALMGVTE